MSNAQRKARQQVEKKNQALTRLRVEYVSVDTLDPNDYNPNRQSEHDFELLLRSIVEDGFTQPIVAVRPRVDPNDPASPFLDNGRLTIVDGEHRWRAARLLSTEGPPWGGGPIPELAEIPVAVTDMTVAQAKIATLRHNRARGSEDMELAAEVLRDLEALGALDWAADSLMLDDVELQNILNDIPAPEALAGDSYEEAWEPTVHTHEHQGETREVSMSAKAADQRRAMEKKLSEAKTREERETIQRESDTFRVVAIFSGDEATLVKSVLGEQTAEGILRLCREKVGAEALP